MLEQKITMYICLLSLLLPLYSVKASTVLGTYKYAWSDAVGYINFANVIVEDSALSGYAWSANAGWINFSPTAGGVLNDGAGNLSGSAWGERLGWIDFNSVSINSATGKFSGEATGTMIGTLTFDCPTFCDVETDWRPLVSIPSDSSGSGSGNSLQSPSALLTVPIAAAQESLDAAKAKLIDIQKDGIINILDFNSLMVNWGSASCGNIADTDNNCNVDIFDFNSLMVYWDASYLL